MRSPTLDEKEAFFAQLQALDVIRDSDDELSPKELKYREQSRAFFKSQAKLTFPKKQKGKDQEDPELSRSKSITAKHSAQTATPGARVIEGALGNRPLAVRIPTTLESSFQTIEETSVPDITQPTRAGLRRSMTMPEIPAPSLSEQSPLPSTAGRKRKRQAAAQKAVHQAPQIFTGLCFYYIPDNDIAPARKLRITRAQEHGAQWVRQLTAASHVIVDKALKYKDIERILGPHPPASLIVVNEDYPLDCISFRTILNPDQRRYKITGFPRLVKESLSRNQCSTQASDRSLDVRETKSSKRRRESSPQGEITSPDWSSPIRPRLAQTKATVQNQAPDSILYQPSTYKPEISRPSEPAARKLTRTGPEIKDELSKYIELIQQYKDLPLDPEEDDVQSINDSPEAVPDFELSEPSDGERAQKRAPVKTCLGGQEISFADRFACSRGGTKDKSTDSQNPNARTIEVLQAMCDYYTRINDRWRSIAYRKAINTLRRQTVEICTAEEAARLPNIGSRLAAKIEEIVSTNRLRRLDYANDEPTGQILSTFLKIYGVGNAQANKWITQGFRTLEDLRQKADLTPNQRIGIEHYDDLNSRIPRAEVEALFAYVRREAGAIDPNIELLVGGSYRRGADSSGDIDIIITKKGTRTYGELVHFLEDLITVLGRKGFLVATLAALHTHRPGKDGPGSKWHGCCVLPKEAGGRDPLVWRRIDFLLVPETEYGAALIYFTGNEMFNRSMRLLAAKKGMRLNQRGLYKEVMRKKGSVKVTGGELVEGRDEKRIFEILGVKWREPWERWC